MCSHRPDTLSGREESPVCGVETLRAQRTRPQGDMTKNFSRTLRCNVSKPDFVQTVYKPASGDSEKLKAYG